MIPPIEMAVAQIERLENEVAEYESRERFDRREIERLKAELEHVRSERDRLVEAYEELRAYFKGLSRIEGQVPK